MSAQVLNVVILKIEDITIFATTFCVCKSVLHMKPSHITDICTEKVCGKAWKRTRKRQGI